MGKGKPLVLLTATRAVRVAPEDACKSARKGFQLAWLCAAGTTGGKELALGRHVF